MGETAEGTIREYYDALRAGAPIHPFFADRGPVVKVGIGERMVGADAVAEGLREQTRTTTDWVVESRDLHVGTVEATDGRGAAERADVNDVDGRDAASAEADAAEPPDATPTLAWFGDEVYMGWTDTDRGIRFEFDTRWSGALARIGERADGMADGQTVDGADGGSRPWRFVEMHVSTSGET